MNATDSSNSSSDLISRDSLAKRWGVSKECVKRKERAGVITGVRFNARLLRYRMEDVLRVEEDAFGKTPPVQLTPKATRQ